MYLTKFCLFLIAGVLFIAACSQSEPSRNASRNEAKPPLPVQATSPAAAADDEVVMANEIYATNCMICHKDTGKGGKTSLKGKTINAEDLTKDKFKKATDEKLAAYISDGIEDEGMPAFKDKLTPDQIKAVVKHVRTLQQ